MLYKILLLMYLTLMYLCTFYLVLMCTIYIHYNKNINITNFDWINFD